METYARLLGHVVALFGSSGESTLAEICHNGTARRVNENVVAGKPILNNVANLLHYWTNCEQVHMSTQNNKDQRSHERTCSSLCGSRVSSPRREGTACPEHFRVHFEKEFSEMEYFQKTEQLSVAVDTDFELSRISPTINRIAYLRNIHRYPQSECTLEYSLLFVEKREERSALHEFSDDSEWLKYSFSLFDLI